MVKRKILIGLLLLIFFNYNFAQKASYYKSKFIDAEYYVLYEDYKEALPLYLEIFNAYPDNKNICYRIGQCYLNLPYNKIQSIGFLEEAAKNISDNYKIGFFSEKKAPKEALFYLGIAYRINNNLDEAISTLNKYKSKLNTNETEAKNEADYQIKLCNNAKELMKNKISYTETNLGELINTNFPEYRPAISANDSIIIFNTQLRFYEAVYFSKKINNKWTTPVNITPNIGSDGTMLVSSLSADGKTLFLTQYDWDNYNIYISNYTTVGWVKAEKFDRKINSRFNETHACMSADGKTIFFVSDREGGYGGKDIYYIVKDSLGNWSEAKNLGPNINTSKNEENPFITSNNILFFSSQGHYNMGGYDIFYSKKQENSWSAPINIGYPLNTTDDDLFFVPLNDGKSGYYSIYKTDGFGEADIYRIDF
jgi:tetratricopeptide (TPR) repeat protein